MKCTAAVVLAAAAVVSATKGSWEPKVDYTTEVVTEYTTYCPEPTTITYNNKTITVTEPTTITITDCEWGCTIKKPMTTYTTEVLTEYTTYCPEPTVLTWGDKTVTVTEPTMVTLTECEWGCTVSKPVYTSSKVYCDDCGKNNATATYKPTEAKPTVEPTKPPVVEAGAAKIVGAGLAAVVGLVAFAL